MSSIIDDPETIRTALQSTARVPLRIDIMFRSNAVRTEEAGEKHPKFIQLGQPGQCVVHVMLFNLHATARRQI